MSVLGGMSKGERNSVKIRVRSAMAAQAGSEDPFLGSQAMFAFPATWPNAIPHLCPRVGPLGEGGAVGHLTACGLLRIVPPLLRGARH
jgi:hypothetical protein